MSSVTHKRWEALGELMLSHLCPAVDPVLVQPHIPDPRLLHYQVFRSVLIRLPHCCLHSSLSCSSPSQTPLHIQGAAPGPQTENRLPCRLPPSATPTRCLAVRALWGPFSPHLSVHTGPSVPEPGAVRRIRKKGGLPFPPAPPGGAHALRGRTWPFMSPRTCPQAVNAGRRLNPACSVPGPLHLLCLLPGCFSRQSQSSHVSPEKWKSLSHVQLFVTSRTIQSMEFSRPEYWSGWPFPSPRDLPNPGIKSRSLALQADSLAAEPQGNPSNTGVGGLPLLQHIFPTQELN